MKTRTKPSLRIQNEIEHGRRFAGKGQDFWYWSTPAGKIRHNRRANLFRQFLGNDKKSVMEIGCGMGLFTQEFARTDNTITALDICDELLDIARSTVMLQNVKFVNANAFDTDFRDNSFDFIVGSSALHHLDVKMAVREFHRLLKPGGQCMFTEPNMLNPHVAMLMNIPLIRRMAAVTPDETAFFRTEIRKKLSKAGFRDVVVTPFDFMHPAIPGFLVRPLERALGALEHVPVLKEFSGSLIITARK